MGRNGSRVIVTGGAGFIGSALVAGLNAAGISDITIVDNLGESEKWRNLVGKRFTRYLHKDAFLASVQAGSWSEKPDTVFHLGACSSTTELNSDYLFKNNVAYSQILCEHALSWGSRFIYASSAATYGLGEQGYDDDPAKLSELKPINRYGFSKHVFDRWVMDKGLSDKVVGLKFFNVFGPNEYHKGGMVSMVLRAAQQIKASGAVRLYKSTSPIFKDGEQRRDFISVKDWVTAMLRLSSSEAKVNGIFNLGTGVSRTWNDLALAVFAALKVSPRIEFIDMPNSLVPGYQNFTEAKMERLKAALPGFTTTTLEAAVDEYVTRFIEPGLVIF